MFIRFDFTNGRLYRMAGVGLAVVVTVSALGKVWNYAVAEGNAKEALGDVAVSMYRQVVLEEYNIATYDEQSGREEDSVMTKLVETINEDNSLYKYMADNELSISFTGVDPLYNYKDVIIEGEAAQDVAALEDTGNTKAETEKDTKDSDTEDNDAKDNEVVNNVAQNTEGDSEYVVPAVAENGITYTMDQLSDFDFLMSKLYTVPSRALVYESDLVAEDMLAKDMTMHGDNSKPQILIYHTHSQEGFVDSVAGDDNTNIVAVGSYLAKILSEEYGYNVIHCQEHFDIAGGSLDRSKAYTYAQHTIEQILEDNPTIEVILDIHRDGLAEGAAKLVTNINGKDTAKIMFFNGVSRSSAAGDIDYLYNRYRDDNLAFSFQLKLMAMKCYPDYTRRNYIDAYQYNLQHREKSVLIEVGAQNNTLQEELNAMEVLAEVLHRVLSPDNS